jgi:hypothetical protein
MGMRLNTREVRYKEKMVKQRNALIEQLIQLDPTFKPPPGGRLLQLAGVSSAAAARPVVRSRVGLARQRQQDGLGKAPSRKPAPQRAAPSVQC